MQQARGECTDAVATLGPHQLTYASRQRGGCVLAEIKVIPAHQRLHEQAQFDLFQFGIGQADRHRGQRCSQTRIIDDSLSMSIGLDR